jgi:23S rRNA (uracil1939-C5)-methyltransferase
MDDTGAIEIDSLDLDGQGVGRRAGGKVVFVDGALGGERVTVRIRRAKANARWEQGELDQLLRESPQRTVPRCPHFGLHAGACGGCRLQHLQPAAQVAVKQRVLEDQLWHLGKVRPDQVLRPIEGPAWGYRWRARLSVRHVAKKGTVLIGFHERASRYVADMRSCAVLPPALSALLVPLRDLIGGLMLRDRIPQIEVAVGDAVIALVLRHLEPLSEVDRSALRAFAQANPPVQWWLQPKGPDSAHPLDADGPELAYTLPEFGLRMPFRPTDFTQVNGEINRVLVGRALRLLDPRPGERVIDWFCGLGNFTLPIASRGASVLGLEGSPTLVARARSNAAAAGLGGSARFEARDLFTLSADDLLAFGSADAWLIDPPRDGAFALAKAVAELHESAKDWRAPRRIAYVSCSPATLARDAGLLVHRGGYRCSAAGVVNMFPHTAHVESIAVFDRDPKGTGPEGPVAG